MNECASTNEVVISGGEVWVQSCVQHVVAPGTLESGKPGSNGDWDGTLPNAFIFSRGEKSTFASKFIDFYSFYVHFYFWILPWSFWPFKQLLNETQVYTWDTDLCLFCKVFSVTIPELTCLLRPKSSKSRHAWALILFPAILVLSLCTSQEVWFSQCPSKGIQCVSAPLWAGVCWRRKW